MTEHGVRWQDPLTGTLHLGRTNRFFLGGGKALVNTYYQTAKDMGIEIAYEAGVVDVKLDGRDRARRRRSRTTAARRRDSAQAPWC